MPGGNLLPRHGISGTFMIKLLLLFLAGTFTAFPALAENLFDDNPAIGTVLRSQIETPHGEIMLPNGDWTLAGLQTGGADAPSSLGKAVLARIGQDNSLDGLIFVTVSLGDGTNYRPTAKQWCARNSDALFITEIETSSASETGCLVIEELVSRLDNLTQPHLKQASSFLANRKATHPDTLYFATFQIASEQKFLSVSYGFDFRLPPTEMLPGYTPASNAAYDGPYSDLTRQNNLDLVKDWAQAKETEIRNGFLN
jgi:hypothetical protein